MICDRNKTTLEFLIIMNNNSTERNGIPSCFIFLGMVQNGIPSVCFYFWSTERNFTLFSLPRNGSEQNSESLLLFLFHGTEFQAFFSFAEWFGTEFREFSVP
jgi:hypothetical protein